MTIDDPKMIYLAPPCCADPNEGRQWCQDNVWDDDCECDGEKHGPTAYLRADIAAAHAVVETHLMVALERLVNDSMFTDHPDASQMAMDALNEAARLRHGI